MLLKLNITNNIKFMFNQESQNHNNFTNVYFELKTTHNVKKSFSEFDFLLCGARGHCHLLGIEVERNVERGGIEIV